MVVGPTSKRPVVSALMFSDREIVDAGDTDRHETALGKLPIFISVAAKPIAVGVVPFVGKSYRDPILSKRPYLLDEPIVQLALPFACQEPLDLRPSIQKFRTVPPAAVFGVGQYDPRRVTTVPGVLSQAR